MRRSLLLLRRVREPLDARPPASRTTHRALVFAALCASLAAVVSCHGDAADGAPGGDAGLDGSVVDSSADVPTDGPDATSSIVPVAATLASARVDVAQLMFASGEMQISGEPFAEGFLGRNLDGYDRLALPTDRYSPSGKFDGDQIPDLVGYSTAVESYEYSKFHVNMVGYQTYAGPSLAWGPVLDAAGSTATDEPTVRDRLRTRIGQLLRAAGTDVGGFAVLPPPASNPYNPLGFSGLSPILVPYRAFDPAMLPEESLARGCSFDSGYGSSAGTTHVPDFECGYASLELSVRRKQLDPTLSPAAIGYFTWKQALWAIDFSGRLHDAQNFFVTKVSPTDEAKVGAIGNTVVGVDDKGGATHAGTFLGSTPLEGMWGLTMLEEMDNAAAFLLLDASTSDGASVSGFASLNDAIAYDYGSPVRWWPTAIAVTEGDPVQWPSPKTLAIADPASRADDLAGLLIGNALFFGMTDPRNAAVGQKLGLRLTFDGDPFPKDNGLADGEATAHDRALSMLRVAFVDLDRLHTFPATSIVTDTAKPQSSGDVGHGAIASTTTLAHVAIALRQTLLSLNGAITQYGGADPSPKLDELGILNSIAIHPPGGDVSFSARVREVLVAQASFVRDVVTTADGSVANAVTFDAAGTPVRDTSPTTLESQTAAIRALLEGFLTTGDATFVERARAVMRRLDADFWAPGVRFYRGVARGPDVVSVTAMRFGFLQSALREVHKIAHVPGDPVLGRSALEARLARVNKLLLNGWDDVNANGIVDVGSECLAARLQLGEQALTGEWGADPAGAPTADRDADCVLSIPFAKVGSLLAGQVDFKAKN